MVLLSSGRNNCLETRSGLQRQKSGVILLTRNPRNYKLSYALDLSYHLFFGGAVCLLVPLFLPPDPAKQSILDQSYALGSGLTLSRGSTAAEREARSLDLLDQLQSRSEQRLSYPLLLLRCSSDTGVDPIERRMLDAGLLDYAGLVQRGAARGSSPGPQALEEMSSIVSFFALFGGPARGSTIQGLNGFAERSKATQA